MHANMMAGAAVLCLAACVLLAGGCGPQDGLKSYIYEPTQLPRGVHLLTDGFGSDKWPAWTHNPQLSGEREFVACMVQVFGEDFDPAPVTECLGVVYVGPRKENIAVFGFQFKDDAAAAMAKQLVEPQLIEQAAGRYALVCRGKVLAMMLMETRDGDACWADMKRLFAESKP